MYGVDLAGMFQAKLQIILVLSWGDSIHIKLTCYWVIGRYHLCLLT